MRIQADVSSNGNISFHYLDTDVGGASATVGLAPVDGGEALTVSSNTPNAAELGVGKALEFQILGRKLVSL